MDLTQKYIKSYKKEKRKQSAYKIIRIVILVILYTAVISFMLYAYVQLMTSYYDFFELPNTMRVF